MFNIYHFSLSLTACGAIKQQQRAEEQNHTFEPSGAPRTRRWAQHHGPRARRRDELLAQHPR